MINNNLAPNENIAAIEEVREVEELAVELHFVRQATLMVAQSQSIMDKIGKDHPVIDRLLNYNRTGTIGFLKANGALSGYRITHSFEIPYIGYDDGVKVWKQYRTEIEKYASELCRGLKNNDGATFYEELRGVRKVLADEIHSKYYEKFPRWPSVGKENTGDIELEVGGSYQSGAFYLVWSCLGWITVTDKRPATGIYRAEFSGKPDIKLLVVDYDKLNELEKLVSSKSIDEAKRMIDENQRTRDLRLLTWEDLK